MNKTSIQWTNWTLQLVRFRPKLTGRVLNWCQKVSPGCAACYAERLTRRFHGAQHSYTPAGRDLVEPFLDRDALRELVTTRRRGMVFVEDMSDLFGDWVSDAWLDECFAAFALSPLTVQVLTKRAERMRAYATDQQTPERICEVLNRRAVDENGADGPVFNGIDWPLPNVWMGVSVEDQERADERIPHLLATPAAVRFVSAEPLLGPVNLSACSLALGVPLADGTCWVGSGSKLDWIIVGGESGPGARPCDLAWIRSLRDQCRAASVACFVKQLGSRAYDSAILGRLSNGLFSRFTPPESCRIKMRDSHGGDPAEWPADLQGCREMPEVSRGE